MSRYGKYGARRSAANKNGGDSLGSGAAPEGGNPYARRYAAAIAEAEHRPGPVRTLAQMTPEERAEMVRLYSRKAK